ncbi:hypothetical protein PAXRUDRAFT_11376 [Paxillus rubicundulus Ve08.2h10]|uniref:Unplaced genomic scaffold scaffold_213, whole genome shotgun sequence n=1 Tax=Paxillus rubicundulus Ve08.2h10 TaxID=930991 RepID=A0A0D0DYY7_9AGAM|nr:hypothetical protein PAXRUDRAFT_11376 [Paxillus rubicundulus Ve08.2h10]
MPSRGRKPNPNIPPSRPLTQQRQFRARKAQLVHDLEKRCRTLEEENVQLRRELHVLAGPQYPEPSPQLMEMSHEVMRNLADTAASMARWQQASLPLASASVAGGPGPCGPSTAMQTDDGPCPSTLASASYYRPHDAQSTTAPSHEPPSASISGPQGVHRPWSTPPVTSPPPSSMFGSFSVVTAESFERGQSGSTGCTTKDV